MEWDFTKILFYRILTSSALGLLFIILIAILVIIIQLKNENNIDLIYLLQEIKNTLKILNQYPILVFIIFLIILSVPIGEIIGFISETIIVNSLFKTKFIPSKDFTIENSNISCSFVERCLFKLLIFLFRKVAQKTPSCIKAKFNNFFSKVFEIKKNVEVLLIMLILPVLIIY